MSWGGQQPQQAPGYNPYVSIIYLLPSKYVEFVWAIIRV